MWVEMATRPVEEYVTDYPLRHHMWRVHSDSPRERSVALENSFLNNNMLLAQSYPNLRATHPNCDILSPTAILMFPGITLGSNAIWKHSS